MRYLTLKEQTLMEINMSPSALRRAAAGINALAGMEFEMIMPNIQNNDDSDGELEQDMDQDTRSIDFDNIENFFDDGEYNSNRSVRDLLSGLQDEFLEYAEEELDRNWQRYEQESVRDYIENNDLFDRDEAVQTASDEIAEANPDLEPESEEFQQLVDARLGELEEEFVQTEIADRGRAYEEAREQYMDDERDSVDESDWLRRNYPYMSNIANNFSGTVTWPHWRNAGEESLEASIDMIADEFSSFMGKPVNASSDYHGARREPGKYVVEPDSSLKGDNIGDSGLEFVSPPMPIDEMLADLQKVKQWAGEQGAYTNDSTGLHINVSVPGFSLEKLDYVKLAVLLGDEYVLEKFGRESNTYTKSALDVVKSHISQRPEDAAKLLDQMREHLSTSAAKAIHSGNTQKYTSINTKTGYIEFRSPGGDWLDENFDSIEQTLLRFVVAMDAAIDETKYKEEYAKKLYKLLAPSTSEPGVLELFTNYSAGELPKDALIRQVRALQLTRDISKGQKIGQLQQQSTPVTNLTPRGPGPWEIYRISDGSRVRILDQTNRQGAETEAKTSLRLRGEAPELFAVRTRAAAQPVAPAATNQVGQIYTPSASGTFTGQWIVLDYDNRILHKFGGIGNSQSDANRVAMTWLRQNPEQMQAGTMVLPELA